MANWLDKYDTPKAQNGIEGTMGGLTDIPFNYNGAWGGQFQMGGNVYPVNYVPKAQDGTETTYSYPLRDKLYPGEDEYFKANPHVGGMAAEDNQVIINPYSPLSDEEKNAIRMNETARLAMRNGYARPTFDLTPEQQESFKNYSTDEQDQRETIIGRILSGDPSAKNVTPEQKKYAEELQKVLKFQGGGSLPGSVGFTYARTKGIPSEGPYAKKTMPSAQNGQEMRYYQEGLDWRPKTISRNGGWLNAYEKAQRGSKIKRTDEASKAVKRSFEITEKPANWIENYFNKALYAITPDYESVEDREKLFKRYRPINYPNVVSAISGLVKDSQLPERDIEGDLNVGEEAWRKALNLPVKEKYIIPSAYKPTKYTDSNSKYYTLNNIIDKEKILAKAKKLGIKPGQKINLESMAPYIKEGFMDVDKFSNIDPLQKFQIDMDPEGKYISIYDKYDFDFAPANKVITPYEFYDRFYLNDKDIPKAKPIVNKLSNKKKEGGIIKDDRGQWAHPHQPTEISGDTMITDGYGYIPLYVVPDKGEPRMVYPNTGTHTFPGATKFTEYPVAQNGYITGDQVKYGSPEYAKAWKEGNVQLANADGEDVPYFGGELDEVVIQNNYKRPRGFWEQSIDKYLKENRDAGLLGAIGSVATYPLSVPQHALTYVTTGKVQDPSEAWGYNTDEGWFDSFGAFNRNLVDLSLNLGADPSNLFSVGLADDALKLSNKAKLAIEKVNPALLTAPKAKNFREVLGTFKGIPTEKSLPRLSSEELKSFRQVQEIGRMRATNKPISEQYRYALSQNISDKHFEKVFGKSKNEVEKILPDIIEQESIRSSIPIRERFNLERPPRRRSSSDAAIDQMNNELNIRTASPEEIQRFADRVGMSVDEVTQFAQSSLPQQTRDETIRRALTNLAERTYNPNELSPIPEELIINAGSNRGRTIINQQRPRLNLLETARDDWQRYVDNKVPTSEVINDKFANIVSEYPYYKGPVLENVPSLSLSTSGNLKNVSKKVQDQSVSGISSGDMFTGSLNTSHNSYLPQLKQIFKYNQGAPHFLGYKPMNDLGFLSDFRYSQDDIAKYLNTEIDQQISRGVIPDNIQRPYVTKKDRVILPHYGIKQFKEGGDVIKDDLGQWKHPGEITEINSPYITMKGVPYPVLGVSDEGDVQLMQPEQEYKFKGKKVREYPMAKNGINNLDAKPLQKLNQLTNFTNYNTKQPGGWMDKYQ